MSFFDLASPVDTHPADHPIVGVERYAVWVEETRSRVVQGSGEIALSNGVSIGDGRTLDNKRAGREVIEQAFIDAGLCDEAYLEQYNEAA